MTGLFKPRMEILPSAQQRLWPELRPAAELGFALYGGTAIALRLGHRHSVDFDFFSEKPLDRDGGPECGEIHLSRAIDAAVSPERRHLGRAFAGDAAAGRVFPSLA